MIVESLLSTMLMYGDALIFVRVISFITWINNVIFLNNILILNVVTRRVIKMLEYYTIINIISN